MSLTIRRWAMLAVGGGLLGGALAQEGEEIDEGLRKFDYRDWMDSYKLFNGVAEAVVVPAAGGRLSVFAVGGRNVLFEDFTVNGLDVEAGVRLEGTEWVQWDGCQPDLYNEAKQHQIEQLWVSPYRVKEEGPRRLRLESRVSRKHKARAVKEFELAENEARLTFRYGVENTDETPRAWAAYYRTLCKTPGLVVFPLDGESRHAGGYVFFRDDATVKWEDEIEAECIRVIDGTVVIAAHELRSAPRAQIFTDAAGGWVAQTWNGVLLVVQYRVDRQHTYVDDCALSVYWQTDKVSIEPRGPYVKLEKGEMASCDTVWRLAELEGMGTSLAEAPSVVAKIKEMVKK